METAANIKLDYHGITRARENLDKKMATSLGKILEQKMAELVAAAKQNLSRNKNIRTGTLREAIGHKVVVEQMSNGKWKIYAMAGIDRKAEALDESGNTIKPIKYAHLVVFSHKARDGSGVLGSPFMRPAVAQVQPTIAAAMKGALEK